MRFEFDTLFICANDSANINGSYYFVTGLYTDTLVSSIGCDSILITEVEISDLLVNLSFAGTPLFTFSQFTISIFVSCTDLALTELKI